MIFELKEKKDKELSNMYEQAMGELNEFFGIGWVKHTPQIVIVNTRKEIDNFCGEKTPNWLIGWANGGKIYLLNRKYYSKESCHKYSKDSYYKTLKHELCHLFFRVVSKAKTMHQFIWFNEGLAGFLAEQYKDKPEPKMFTSFLDQYDSWDGSAYGESAYAVKALGDKFGKKKLILLIKSLDKVKTEKDFNKVFKKVYGKKLSYSFFNKLLTTK